MPVPHSLCVREHDDRIRAASGSGRHSFWHGLPHSRTTITEHLLLAMEARILTVPDDGGCIDSVRSYETGWFHSRIRENPDAKSRGQP